MSILRKYSNNNRETGLRSFKIKILVALLLFLIFFSSYHFLKTKYRQKEISQEVEELQKEIEEFEKKNKNLEQLSQYLQTDDFKERESKQKLNLVKEGEKVVIVKKDEIEKSVQVEEKSEPEVKIDRPNYYYWWHYFFGIKGPQITSTNSYEK